MKQNWTYKKLGEVCTIERGGSPRPINDYITDDPNGLNWIKIGDAIDGSKYITSTKGKITPEGLKKTRLVHKGDFILSNSMSFGKPYILEIDGCIHDGWLVIHDNNGTFDKSFLYYLLGSPNMYREFQRLAVGGVVNNLNSEIVRNVVVPLPPLATQTRIVSELDLLQSIIDKQKAQLKEYDTLAQSIFYDMFGDPVENEKEWETKRLEDLCDVSSSKRVLVEDVVESGIPFLRGTELTALSKVVSSKDVNFTMFITPEHYERVKAITGVPKKGDILIPSINSEGITWVVDTDEPFYFKDGRVIWVHVNTNAFVSKYLSSVISKVLKANYSVLTSGATFLELKLFIIRDLIVPVPPLSLQQSFAAKIESIEKQKAAISKSIAETEKLFEYTMDKYFG